ncbi:phosphodiester glycosidase family protein [Psychroserpens sp. SPM9]|uniref:phosphodiester glycosidase family protein n=1 Tax=Psychroserpens sp. SPM9 TaxID=2975598 RepID=UPI0021A945F4|nr:phosphodiester glycosidase family protein [Psychroserpens sp. SPM9]MDG5490895.1 phosphodiester glycosidase family protein [Psychroserpens sp. SPM9]
MKKVAVISLLGAIILIISLSAFRSKQEINDPRFIIHTLDLKKQTLKFYLQNKQGINYGNHYALKQALEKQHQNLVFAMNGGMYLRDGSPQGLYIENGITKTKIDTIKKGYGNFYLQPNGVFYITKAQKGVVCKTSDFLPDASITYATQSGPMLVIDNNIHPVFVKDSKHYNIRNGVGILPNGNLLFAMSKDTITLYDFADFFKSNGCKNALYLDGKISKTYLPNKNWEQLDGNFGVIIAETKP